MDIDQARSFLAITAHGSFLEAARQTHLTQSIVSAYPASGRRTGRLPVQT
jgi:DNA-binding transcriptional LysR family regulator